MRDGDRHVVPNPDGGWDVKAENAKRASSHHETQAEAIERAREIIRNKGGGELSVHGEDGQVRQKDTVDAEAPATASTASTASTAGAGAVNLPSGARTTAGAGSGSVSKAGGPTPVVDTLRQDGGMAQTDRPSTAAPNAGRSPQKRPSLGTRVKGLFGRSKG
jgi:hypothetical protein